VSPAGPERSGGLASQFARVDTRGAAGKSEKGEQAKDDGRKEKAKEGGGVDLQRALMLTYLFAEIETVDFIRINGKANGLTYMS
jgi:hypothetical protein